MMNDDYDLDEYEASSHWPHAEPPNSQNNLQACIPCLLVKTFQQFREYGCENCMEAFELRENDEKIEEVTTKSFEGLVAITRPPESWVARWQFVQNFIPGVYALKVEGSIGEDSARELADKNIPNIGKWLQQSQLDKTKSPKKQ